MQIKLFLLLISLTFVLCLLCPVATIIEYETSNKMGLLLGIIGINHYELIPLYMKETTATKHKTGYFDIVFFLMTNVHFL